MSGTHALQEIATTAARLVVENGLDYASAKRRAARELRSKGPLPSDEQVEDEVRSHIEIFCAGTQPAELRALRDVALTWMRRLAEFRPHLAGAVWRGTATRHSAVQIDLYCDDSKSAELALVNAGVDYDVAQRERRRGGEPVDVLVVTTKSAALGDWVTLHLAVHDTDDQRGALRPDARGRSWRGDIAALERLLQPEAA